MSLNALWSNTKLCYWTQPSIADNDLKISVRTIAVKRTHTIKMLVISNPNKRIHYLSEPFCGSVHDYAILNVEFSPDDPLWISGHDLYVDLAFLGIQRDYESEWFYIPIKRSRRKSKKDPKIEFSEERKINNKSVSRDRIYVQNSIGGMKRYWWLIHRLRCRDADFYSLIARVAAGLWNFHSNPHKTYRYIPNLADQYNILHGVGKKKMVLYLSTARTRCIVFTSDWL